MRLCGDTHRVIPALDVMRCPVCRGSLEGESAALRCLGCGAVYPVEEGIPRMLDDRLPGIEAKRGEIGGWVAMAKAQGWYQPDDEVDAVLPYVCRDLDWDDKSWRANEYSFSVLLERYVRPGMRVLDVGAAHACSARAGRSRTRRRKRPSGSTSTFIPSTPTFGSSRVPASPSGASSTPRATRTCADGGSEESCCGSRWSAGRRRPGSPRPATATRV